MRLSEILFEDSQYGTFVGVKFDPETCEMLRKFAEDNDIPNPVPSDDYHCTVIYSKKYLPNMKAQGKLDDDIVANPKDFDLFGEDKDSLVLKLDAPDLVKRHKDLMKEHGATYDFDEYIPHVTLSYDAPDFDLDDLDPDDLGTLVVVEEYSEDIDPDFKNDRKEDDD